MNKSTTDTPRTDALIMECPSHLQEVSLSNLAMDLERELAALETEFQHYRENQNTFTIALCEESEQRAEKAGAEVERLKKMVIEAAELGDKRSENFKARAEKAEASLIKINEELCQAGLREYGN